MRIEKVLNNNVVTVIDDQNFELVVMGRGLAFKKKRGDFLEEDKIEKIFTLSNQKLSDKLKRCFLRFQSSTWSSQKRLSTSPNCSSVKCWMTVFMLV